MKAQRDIYTADGTTQANGKIEMQASNVETLYTSNEYRIYANINVTWERGSLTGNERVYIRAYDTATGTQIASGDYQLLYNNPTRAYISYTPPTSKSVYFIYTLYWQADLSMSTLPIGSFDVSLPDVLSASWSDIKGTAATVTVTSNYGCSWAYSLNGGATWMLTTALGSTAVLNVTGLVRNASNTVLIRATRSDLGNTSSSYTTSVTTRQSAAITAWQSFYADLAEPSIVIRVDVYEAGTYSFALKDDGASVAGFRTQTLSVGTSTITLSVGNAARTNILNAMSTVTAKTFTLEMSLSGVVCSAVDIIGRVTSQQSAPVWTDESKVDIYIGDTETQEFFSDSLDITNGVISGITLINAQSDYTLLHNAQARNGASIDHYFISVGGIVTESQYDVINAVAPTTVEGSTVEIIYGAVDTRGYEVTVSYTVPVWKYTPMYWQQTDIARRNGYDNEIDFTIRAKYDPLEATVGGTTYTNVPSTQITMRYSTDNGTTWNTTTLVGTNNTTDDTIDYTGTPLNITNTANVLIELTASDLLSSAPLTMTVPNGVPLISFADGKITINGDVEINGNLVVNGTITQNTPSTDLTGTTWQIKNSYTELDCPWTTVTYYINFTSNNTNYTSLKFDNYSIYYGNTAVFYPPPPQWSNQNYRTIAITGGTDTTNADLIDWLNNYAVQQ